MKLNRFRIYNFRSIRDSEWNTLSPDGITGIIGQNESGKTSILEALNSFFTGEVSEDVLRSDLTLPEVSCCFTIEPSRFNDILKDKLLPEGVKKEIKSSRQVCLTRIWNEDMESLIELDGEKVTFFFKQHDQKIFELEEKLDKKIEKFIDEKQKLTRKISENEQNIKHFEEESDKLKLLLADHQKEWKAEKNQVKKKGIEIEVKEIKTRIEKRIAKYEHFRKEQERDKGKMDSFGTKLKLSTQAKDAEERFDTSRTDIETIHHELAKMQRLFNSVFDEREKRGIRLELDKLNDRHVKALKEFDQAREDFYFKRALASKALSGLSLPLAEKEVKEEKPHLDPYYSVEEAGNILFRFIPDFVLFEDFSSLLPNRIDLEDILNKDCLVEGCRAATNYLKISGLSSSFFGESSSRILKQKIERLNKEVTLDFQDFWKQKVGKQNKITINFELEHYDQSHPDKSGKPFLEFWIKDKQERLYPKQRSRGVRWFLSFYLELKAAAGNDNNRGKVMLIDEPGLSLHARAQEDVLKVFEYIKDKIQIVYTTHSPHLIDSKKLYRLLAVQRSVEDEESNDTRIFNAKSLTSASADTLSPIYTLIGSRLSEQQFIRQKNNVILQDIATYYYLSTIQNMIGFDQEVYFLPATSSSNVRTLVNLLLGWGLEFIVLTEANPDGININDELKKNLCRNDEKLIHQYLLHMEQFPLVEDLFSTLDFKNFILHQRIGIPESNSDFLKENRFSRTLLASNFVTEVQEKPIRFADFDEETRENFKWLFQGLSLLLK